MTADDRTGIAASRITSESVERDAKDRAADVVLAWRRVDWKAVAAGSEPALAGLREVVEAHESARRFLQDEAGEVGVRLDEGLARFFEKEVAGRLDPATLLRLMRPRERRSGGEGLVPRGRPTVTIGHTVRMNTGCGNLYVTVNESDDGRPFELFNHMGKAGGCAASQNEAIGRLISYAMRCGASVEPLIKQLKGISCHRPAWGEDGKISSCSDAIGKALEKYYIAKSAQTVASAEAAPGEPAPASDRRRMADAMTSSGGNGRRLAEVTGVQGACPDCGSQLAYEEGCVKCHSCGFTECG